MPINNSVDIQRAYMNWLYDIVEKRRNGQDLEHRELAMVLYEIDFKDLVPNDDNRAMDGIHLREEFESAYPSYDCDVLFENRECTVLEMLIALSRRMEDVLYDPSRGNQTAKWFWLLVNNLGLEPVSTTDPDYEDIIERNKNIVDRFVNRQYSKNGKGGLFPLKNPPCDQREMEIWYQMMAYIQENSG